MKAPRLYRKGMLLTLNLTPPSWRSCMDWGWAVDMVLERFAHIGVNRIEAGPSQLEATVMMDAALPTSQVARMRRDCIDALQQRIDRVAAASMKTTP